MAPSATSVAAELAQRFVAQDHLRDALSRQTITQGYTQVVDRLAAIAAVESFEPGEVLIHQGRTDTDILLILAGNVVVSPNGRDDTTRGVHNHVGEMATIDPAVRRSATVRASEPTVVARVREADFQRNRERSPFPLATLGDGSASAAGESTGTKVRKQRPFIHSFFVGSVTQRAAPQGRSMSPRLDVNFQQRQNMSHPAQQHQTLEDEMGRRLSRLSCSPR